MIQYLNLLQDVLDNGIAKTDRTGTGTLSVFGRQVRFDLSDGYLPLVTTKEVHFKSILHELLWFISGDTNTKYLTKNGVTIWNEWADKKGNLGPIYGHQWRKWPKLEMEAEIGFDGENHYGYEQLHNYPIDQLANVIESIKNDPDSRRHIVSAWNVSMLDEMALVPCHALFQFYVADGKLSCQLYQRSADLFLGVPYNIASYSILTMMIAQICNLELGEFVHTFGDLHLYSNHLEQAKLQLTREPKEDKPVLKIRSGISSIDDFVYDDFKLLNYLPHPHIKAKVAI